jgi:hypothetical protein
MRPEGLGKSLKWNYHLMSIPASSLVPPPINILAKQESVECRLLVCDSV